MKFVRRLLKQLQYLRGADNLQRSFLAKKTDLTINEQQCITKYVNKFPSPIYVEIGVYYGGTFATVLAFLQKNKASWQAFGIDLFESVGEESPDRTIQTHHIKNKWNGLNVAGREELDHKLTEKGFRNYTLIKGTSHHVVKELPVIADVFFIDANHTYAQTKLDAEACLLKAKVGSYLIFHNASANLAPDAHYKSVDGGPWKVCEELKQSPRVEYIELIDRCAVFQVR